MHAYTYDTSRTFFPYTGDVPPSVPLDLYRKSDTEGCCWIFSPAGQLLLSSEEGVASYSCR